SAYQGETFLASSQRASIQVAATIEANPTRIITHGIAPALRPERTAASAGIRMRRKRHGALSRNRAAPEPNRAREDANWPSQPERRVGAGRANFSQIHASESGSRPCKASARSVKAR